MISVSDVKKLYIYIYICVTHASRIRQTNASVSFSSSVHRTTLSSFCFCSRPAFVRSRVEFDRRTAATADGRHHRRPRRRCGTPRCNIRDTRHDCWTAPPSPPTTGHAAAAHSRRPYWCCYYAISVRDGGDSSVEMKSSDDDKHHCAGLRRTRIPTDSWK